MPSEPASKGDSESPEPEKVRLQRFLASGGYGSRRACEELITAGRVAVNGETVLKLGTTVDPRQDRIEVDGERVRSEPKKYYMLNKPAGYLCTAYDPAHRPLVLDLFPDEGPRLFTVGRLDENTTGLLIVTNDGELAQRLAHPRYRIYRQYKALVAGLPTREICEQLKQGFYFTEGKFRAYEVQLGKRQGSSTWIEVTMIEGQNREIRRLFARVGHKVMKLERIGFGPLHLGRLPQGQFRELLPVELSRLQEILDRNVGGKALKSGSGGARKPGKSSTSLQGTTGSRPPRDPRKPAKAKKRLASGKQNLVPPSKKRPPKTT